MNSKAGAHFWGYLKTLLISYGLAVLMLAGLAVLMWQMRLGASEADWGVMVIYLLTCGAGGFLTGRRVETGRLLWGLVFGLLYFAVLLLLSLLFDGGIQGEIRQTMTVLAACLAGSAVGAFIS